MSAGPTERAVLAALGLSAAGHVVHNLAEFPLEVLWQVETTVPLAVTILLGAWLRHRPGPAAFGVAGAWAVVVIIGGGASVLPLGVLPFAPEQSARHYAAHAAYALLQGPLAWVAVRGLRASRGRSTGEVRG